MARRRFPGADRWFRTASITLLGVTLVSGECLHAQATPSLAQLFVQGRNFEPRAAIDEGPAVGSPDARGLAGLPPQRVVQRTETRVRRGREGQVPVRMGESVRGYLLDARSSLSVMTRSEAEGLGLSVRPADVLVATSAGSVMAEGVTIAPRVQLGGVELADVAFLVVPDEVLALGGASPVAGILGFPVLDALGEVEFRRDGTLRIPETVPVRQTRNLAMDGLRALVHVQLFGQSAVCELDAEGGQSALYTPFLERVRSRIGAEARMDTIRTVGAGGERRDRAYILHHVALTFGGTTVELPRLPAYPNTSPGASREAVDCKIGPDVLNSSAGYVMNLRSMAVFPLELEAPRRLEGRVSLLP